MRVRQLTILICLFFVIPASVFAQTPLGFNYQGVARSADGSPLINQFIGLRVSITSGPSGSTDYIEDHHPETNEFGLFSIVVGQGQSSGNISNVDWGEGNKWLQIEIDPEDNANYILVGSQQMMSVPYSLYSAKSGEALNPGIGIDISNGQINNVLPDRTLTLTGTGAATVSGTYPNFAVDVPSIVDADMDPANEIQDISTSGVAGNINLSEGSEITLNVDDADADSTNEIQTISKTGGIVTLSNSGGSFTDEVIDADADITNEIQDISTSGVAGNISLSDGSDITLNVDDADASPTNEIQTLTDVLAEGANAGALTITNLADPMDVQDAATKNYVDVQDATLAGTITSNTTDISAEVADRATGDTMIQNELDLTEAGAGLNTDGTFTEDLTTTYLQTATSLKQSDKLLDTQLATNTVDISTNSGAITTETTVRETEDVAIQTELNVTQTGSGLEADGSYLADGTATYLGTAGDLKSADKLLDTQLATNTGTISANSTAVLAETTSRTTADGAIQAELNVTQTGAGLEADGSYLADGTTTYLGAVADLKSADKTLDSEIANNSTNITSLTSRLDNTNAFQAEFNINEPAGVIQAPVTLNELIDNFGQIALNEITVSSTGLYMIVVDAERINSDNNFELLYIRINGVDSTIGLGGQGQNFNRSQILSLISGDKISLLATSTGAMSFPVSGLISGYKISD